MAEAGAKDKLFLFDGTYAVFRAYFAIQGLRAQGRRHIAVGSFFLSSDELYHAQADQAHRSGVVAVSDPLGPAREVLDLVLARYAFAAMDLLDFEQADEPARHDDLPLDAFSA